VLYTHSVHLASVSFEPLCVTDVSWKEHSVIILQTYSVLTVVHVLDLKQQVLELVRKMEFTCVFLCRKLRMCMIMS